MPCDQGAFGALGGIRTPNLLIRSQMLYPLSYERRKQGILGAGRPEASDQAKAATTSPKASRAPGVWTPGIATMAVRTPASARAR